MNAKGRRGALIFPGSVCLLLAVPAVLTWRQVRQGRQDRLNQALIRAAKRSDYKEAVRLLKQGADPNCRERETAPISPWHMLLDLLQGKRPKQGSGAGLDAMTPLAYAAGGNAVSIRGNASGTRTQITYFYGLVQENTALVRVLLAYGARTDDTAGRSTRPGSPPITPLLYSITTNRPAITQMLLAQGARINGPDTAILVSAASHQPALLVNLLAHGADINARDPSRTERR